MLWWTLRQLRSKNSATRQRTAKKLVADRDMKTLTAILAKDPYIIDVRAFEEIGREAVESLVALLKHENAVVRRGAARRLRDNPDTRSVEPLVGALQDEDIEVRRTAINALEQSKDKRAILPLVAMAMLKDKGISTSARVALYEIDRHWAKSEAAKAAVPSLIDALKDKDGMVRQRAAELLSNISDTRAVEPLIAALKDEEDSVRNEAVKALGYTEDTRGVEPLLTVLKDQSPQMRAAAAKALRFIPDLRAIEPLTPLLKNEDRDERVAAAEALGAIGRMRAGGDLPAALQDASALLVARLGDGEMAVRVAAARALGQFGETPVVEPLLRILKEDETAEVKEAVAEAIGRIADVIAAQTNRTTKEVAEAVGRIVDPRALSHLSNALQLLKDLIEKAERVAHPDPVSRAVKSAFLAAADASGQGSELLSSLLGVPNDQQVAEAQKGLARYRDAYQKIEQALTTLQRQ